MDWDRVEKSKLSLRFTARRLLDRIEGKSPRAAELVSSELVLGLLEEDRNFFSGGVSITGRVLEQTECPYSEALGEG